MKKLIVVASIVLVIGAGLVGVLLTFPKASQAPSTDATSQAKDNDTPSTTSSSVPGRYIALGQGVEGQDIYTETILFFHAPWCPECRAFEAAIEASEIPEGVQIVKVDYDSATELRQRYGVTLQSTFVSIDKDGNATATWVGYGKDKSVNAILENT